MMDKTPEPEENDAMWQPRGILDGMPPGTYYTHPGAGTPMERVKGKFNPVTGQFVPTPKPVAPPVDPVADKPTVQMYGQQNIREMSTEELIEELCHHHRVAYQRADKTNLRHLVVHARVATYSDRMHREAGGGYSYGGSFSIEDD